MGTAVRLTTRRQSLLCLSHPSITMQKTLLLVLLVAFVASTSAFHFGLGGIGYGLGYGYGMPYGYGIGGYGLGVGGYGLGTASEDTPCLERVTTKQLQPYI